MIRGYLLKMLIDWPSCQPTVMVLQARIGEMSRLHKELVCATELTQATNKDKNSIENLYFLKKQCRVSYVQAHSECSFRQRYYGTIGLSLTSCLICDMSRADLQGGGLNPTPPFHCAGENIQISNSPWSMPKNPPLTRHGQTARSAPDVLNMLRRPHKLSLAVDITWCFEVEECRQFFYDSFFFYFMLFSIELREEQNTRNNLLGFPIYTRLSANLRTFFVDVLLLYRKRRFFCTRRHGF